MTRLSNLPSETLDTWTTRLQSDLDEMKSTSQPVSSGIIYHVSDSGVAYDWSGTLGTFGSNKIRQLLVTAVGDHADNVIANLFLELWVGSMSNRYDGFDYIADRQAGVTPYGITFNTYASNYLTPNVKQWVVNVTGPATSTATCFVKFHVVGTDSMTVSSVVSY